MAKTTLLAPGTATVSQETRPKMDQNFFGRAWINTAKSGQVYVQLLPDMGVTGVIKIEVVDKVTKAVSIAEIDLKQGIKFQLWGNTKREGKKDADYRAVVLSPAMA
jgi:hypothetical protein